MTTPANPPAWQRITPENQPQFPCWLWVPTATGGIASPTLHEFTWRNGMMCCTHWHAPQPDAPTSGPEATQHHRGFGGEPAVLTDKEALAGDSDNNAPRIMRAAVALTPASALARQREKEKAT